MHALPTGIYCSDFLAGANVVFSPFDDEIVIDINVAEEDLFVLNQMLTNIVRKRNNRLDPKKEKGEELELEALDLNIMISLLNF